MEIDEDKIEDGAASVFKIIVRGPLADESFR